MKVEGNPIYPSEGPFDSKQEAIEDAEEN